MYEVIGYLPNSSNMEIFDVDFETPRWFLKIFIWNFSSLFLWEVFCRQPLIVSDHATHAYNNIGLIWVSKSVRCVLIFFWFEDER